MRHFTYFSLIPSVSCIGVGVDTEVLCLGLKSVKTLDVVSNVAKHVDREVRKHIRFDCSSYSSDSKRIDEEYEADLNPYQGSEAAA